MAGVGGHVYARWGSDSYDDEWGWACSARVDDIWGDSKRFHCGGDTVFTRSEHDNQGV